MFVLLLELLVLVLIALLAIARVRVAGDGALGVAVAGVTDAIGAGMVDRSTTVDANPIAART
jgi:hypothetical protein